MKYVRIKYIFSILGIYLFVSFVLFFKFENKSSDQSKLNINHFETSESALTLDDILITVKTSSIYYDTRLQYIYETWFNYESSQIYFVTDTISNEQLKNQNDLFERLVPTNCSSGHGRDALCCKFGTELGLFFNLKRKFKWFCHVDDDNYVNIPNLIKFLSYYDPNKDWYIGRSSWSNKKVFRTFPKKYLPIPATFGFGTLGAGVCISNFTMYKLKNYSNHVNYSEGCKNMLLPDDMFLGYLIDWKLKINLTNSMKFNHHLDINQFRNMNESHDKITFGFGKPYRKNYTLLPDIPVLFENDTLRIKSFHCFLFPKSAYCRNKKIIKI